MCIIPITECVMKTNIGPLLALSLIIVLSGCATTNIENQSLRATERQPEANVVEQVKVPLRADRPRFVFVVEPFETIPSLYTPQDSLTVQSIPNNDYLRAKLTTALANVENFSLLDPRGLQRGLDGTVKAPMKSNEMGPYLIRATVTEFSERVEESSKKREFSAGAIGIALGLAGLITDKPGLIWPGAGLAVANPNFSSENEHRKGMVSFDVQVVDGKTMRIIKSLKASGTFLSENARNQRGVFGYKEESTDSAQSILGQATQAAYNDLITKLSDSFLQ